MSDQEGKDPLHSTSAETPFGSTAKLRDGKDGGPLKYPFKELLDIPKLQELTDDLYRATGIPSTIVEMTGDVLTSSGWQSICSDFHRKHPLSEKECIESNLRHRKRLDDGEPFVIYRCPRGLIDASAPVIIENEHVANVLTGQLFTEPPDAVQEEFFRQQARKFGFDEAKYMEAYRRIPVLPEERFRSVLQFLAKMAQMIADIGLSTKHERDALRELRIHEDQYRRLLESIKTVAWELELPSKKIKYMGPQVERMFGYPLSCWRDLDSWIGFIHDDDRDGAVSFLAGEFTTGHNRDFECRMIAQDGHVLWVQTVVTVASGAEGPESLVGFLRDITERKRTDEAFRESEERFRLAFYTSPDSVNLNRLADGLFVDINEGFTRLTGFTCQDVIGRTSLDINLWCHPSDREKLVQGLRERGYYENLEADFRRKDGSVTTALMSAKIFVLKGVPHILSITRDISYRKRLENERHSLEERLQRAEKMEALGTLAGGVAHDLNNVLGIVVGYAEMLIGEMDEASPARNHSQKVLESGLRAAAIVQDLLTLARRGVQTRNVVSLNTLIMDCQNMPEFERILLWTPRIRIRTELDADLLNILGSPVHLGKTLINLVYNAVEAMPDGGELTITTRNQYLDRPLQGYDRIRDGDYVVLSVSDTGEGISAQDMKRIFEPFYTKKVMGRSGTGLGLAVVWGTVKDHNGYINVQSEEGKGSAFSLYFPVTREAASPESPSVPLSEYLGKGEMILVVDDVEGQRELAVSILERLKYRVTAVASGEEALAHLKDHPVDLVVLDMIMDPGMDGLETYQGIIEIRPRQKAVIVSGFSETDRVNQAQALGAGAYVRKPYMVERLGAAVRKELDKPDS
jgi:two-component system, cell cycle sensor histidine kinase and response regulator CckA